MGLWVMLVTLLAATAFGVWRQRSSGQVRARKDSAQPQLAGLPGALGERATLVQFSAPACAPCRTTHRVLTQIAAERPDVVHLEIDAAENLALTKSLAITRTPTVLFLDPTGRETHRAVGAMKRADVLAVLGD